jgi:hypothetical protein
MVIENRCAFDQGKPADRSGARDWLKGGNVNSVLQGRLARGMDDRGFAPETPVKGGIALDEPRLRNPSGLRHIETKSL